MNINNTPEWDLKLSKLLQILKKNIKKKLKIANLKIVQI